MARSPLDRRIVDADIPQVRRSAGPRRAQTATESHSPHLGEIILGMPARVLQASVGQYLVAGAAQALACVQRIASRGQSFTD